MLQIPFTIQTDLKRGVGQIRREIGDLKELLAVRRRERACRDIKYQLAAARFGAALIRDAHVCRKAGFNPDQPRVPAGNREGGQWTSESGATALSVSAGGTRNASRIRLADTSNVLGSQVMSDATPDPVTPGAQYAQSPVNFEAGAMRGIPTIDDTTMKLAKTLAHVKDVVAYTTDLTPQKYGTAVHTAFAAKVKSLGLPGVAPSDVETTWGGSYYGAEGSVRTDVVLRNDMGNVIAIYDVKTGKKGIEPARAAELRLKVGVGNDVPVIQMSFEAITLKCAPFGNAFLVQTVLNYGG